jgi:hypothetical protein
VAQKILLKYVTLYKQDKTRGSQPRFEVILVFLTCLCRRVLGRKTKERSEWNGNKEERCKVMK